MYSSQSKITSLVDLLYHYGDDDLSLKLKDDMKHACYNKISTKVYVKIHHQVSAVMALGFFSELRYPVMDSLSDGFSSLSSSAKGNILSVLRKIVDV